MKYLSGVAGSAAIAALCVGSMAAAQERPPLPVQAVPAPSSTTPPPVMVPPPAPATQEIEAEERSLFEIMAEGVNRRLDPQQRAQALLDEIPIAVAIEPMALAEMFTRTEILHRSVAIDVPLRLTTLSGNERAGSVWHTGDAPKDRYLGETGARAASAATTNVTWKDGSTGEIDLYEARFRSTDDKNSLTTLEGVVYCGTQVATPSGEKDMCLIDRDGDRSFDEFAFIASRSGKSVHGATVLTAAVPMQVAAPYTVRNDGLPEMKAQWTTCGKDWDLPYYQLRLGTDEHGNEPASRAGTYWGDPYCAKSEKYERVEPANKGGRVARMGPAYAQISSKKSGASIQLERVLDTETLYRVEGRDKLAPLSAGFAPAQAQLSANQQFTRLPYQSTGDVTVAETPFKVGDHFVTSAFRHGYTGVVTEDVKIRTLLSSRSVEGGMPVYGVPAKRTTVTYGGYGYQMPATPAIERKIDMDLIWCLPTREEIPLVDRDNKPTGNVKIEWTATCLPDNRRGQHTILKDQSPALAVRNMRMDATISTNDGPPPVAERANADFGAPLYFRYSLKEASKNLYTLTEEVLLGEEVTSSNDIILLKDEDGKAVVEVAGGSFMLEPDGEQYKLTAMLPPREGEDARVKGLDVMALMRRLLADIER
ncbi:hypothetical protein [Qipengyuania aquimaris]|uniref:Secreted protein n=1 Tax=Qipengyuania aquimaris TaxID=255984 RepID=A0A9Q3XDJ8_9SPHN|nr:hypothetical protein [Qipengyuania aquimaris]MBY6217945.1 hypothetical protein [Qipengyuania aquimaris]